MTLTDTGPLVAIIDEDDANSAKITAAISLVPSWPIVTTQACFTEALYLLGKVSGWNAQSALWAFLRDGSLVVLDGTPQLTEIARLYMDRFSEMPCDYADATLLAVAESVGYRTVFTLDKHFYAYRLRTGEALNVFP